MQTVMHKTRTDLHFLCDMGQGPLTCLLGYVVAKSLGCPLISAAGAICFRKRSLTPRTTKSSFVHDQIDLIPPKRVFFFGRFPLLMTFLLFFFHSGPAGVFFFSFNFTLMVSSSSILLLQNLEFGRF